jgi:hypothetical protein
MAYTMEMQGERPPQVLFKEGWREVLIKAIREQKSKAGNDMFVVCIQDKETKDEIEVYMVATQGKRWMLKTFLTACGIKAAADGVFIWDFKDVLEKTIQAKIKHEEEEWINREGQTVKTLKSRVTEFKYSEVVGWDDAK